MEYNLKDNVIVTPLEGDEFLAHITGIIIDERTDEKRYFVNGLPNSYPHTQIRLMTLSFDVFVDLDSGTAEFKVTPIHDTNNYLKADATFVDQFYITETKPEIIIYIYWNIKPGTIPRRYVESYLSAIYSNAATVSERSN